MSKRNACKIPESSASIRTSSNGHFGIWKEYKAWEIKIKATWIPMKRDELMWRIARVPYIC